MTQKILYSSGWISAWPSARTILYSSGWIDCWPTGRGEA